METCIISKETRNQKQSVINKYIQEIDDKEQTDNTIL